MNNLWNDDEWIARMTPTNAILKLLWILGSTLFLRWTFMVKNSFVTSDDTIYLLEMPYSLNMLPSK